MHTVGAGKCYGGVLLSPHELVIQAVICSKLDIHLEIEDKYAEKMTREPLRSAMSIGNSEDTSLALPSDNTLRTGQRRVLDQVHTIKRTKSKQLKNGSLSPTSKLILPLIMYFLQFKHNSHGLDVST